ncbi:MAG TPA: cupredoxin domain-containing protein [Acidimicrobiia bacterium]|jgi:plastocyanin|nr:cupredoxin domain-containing protein [Acidimicrobiia bacterium]
MPRRWNRRVSLAALLASGLLFAACGGGGGGSVTKTAVNGAITVNASDPYNFDVKTIKASPGPLTVTLHEKGSQQHTFSLSSPKFELVVTSSKPDATGTVTLKAGTYPFKCSFDGHAAAGMTGTIVVG